MIACQDDDTLDIAQLLWKRKDIDHFRVNKSKENVMQVAEEYECKKIVAWLKEINYEQKFSESAADTDK